MREDIYTKDNTLKKRANNMIEKLLSGEIPDALFPSVVVVAAAVPELEVLDASV